MSSHSGRFITSQTAYHVPHWQTDFEALPDHEAARTMIGWSGFQMASSLTV